MELEVKTSKKEKPHIPSPVPHEEIAAITMALHLHLNSYRDKESEIITIDMPSARYSPWALKSLVMKRVVRK